MTVRLVATEIGVRKMIQQNKEKALELAVSKVFQLSVDIVSMLLKMMCFVQTPLIRESLNCMLPKTDHVECVALLVKVQKSWNERDNEKP